MTKAGPRPIRAKNALDTVEAAYTLEGTDAEWLAGILRAAREDIDFGAGTYALTLGIVDGKLEPAGGFATNELAPSFAALVPTLNATAPPILVTLLASRAVTCGTMASAFGASHPATLHFRSTVAPAGFRDGFSLFAQDGEHGALVLSGPARHEVVVNPRIVGIWRRIGIHLAAGWRLRRRFAAHRGSPDALVDPGGTIHDASGIARSTRSRETLTAGVRAIERARSRKVRADPEAALQLWRGLVGGEWSLVDHWESDGRRFLAAFQNRPHVRDPRALSEQERVVLRYGALGSSNKEIAFTLGVSEGAVADAMSRVLRKLRCRRRSDLVAFADPAAAQRLRVPLGTGAAELDVLAIDVAITPERLNALTPAERDVARRAALGQHNDEIARSRSTSANTVAKQLRAIYEKLGIESRTELARALTRR